MVACDSSRPSRIPAGPMLILQRLGSFGAWIQCSFRYLLFPSCVLLVPVYAVMYCQKCRPIILLLACCATTQVASIWHLRYCKDGTPSFHPHSIFAHILGAWAWDILHVRGACASRLPVYAGVEGVHCFRDLSSTSGAHGARHIQCRANVPDVRPISMA